MHTFSLLLTLLAMIGAFDDSDLNIGHFDKRDGLSNGFVYDMAQDSKGFVYIATIKGLNRFDGTSFTTFTSENSELPSDQINTLYFDARENTLWIGLWDGNICLLDCETQKIRTLEFFEGNKWGGISDISSASDGGLWVTQYGDRIVHYDLATNQIRPLLPDGASLSTAHHWFTFDNGSGLVYVGNHEDAGMTVVDCKSGRIHTLHHDPADDHSLPGDRVYCMNQDHLGNLWVGTNNGLGRFDPVTETFTVFRHNAADPNSLIADHIYNICDIEGKLWIASDIGGVSVLDLSSIAFTPIDQIRFTNLTEESPGLSSRNVRQIMPDRFGNVWIGYFGAALDVIGHRQNAFKLLPYLDERFENPRMRPVWGLCGDGEGNLWLGSENQVSLWNKGQKIRAIDTSPVQNRNYAQILAVTDDETGGMLFGLFDDGVVRYNPASGQLQRLQIQNQSTDILTYSHDSLAHCIWVCTEFGLYKYTKDGSITFCTDMNNQMSDKSIYGIYRDAEQRLWVISYGGYLYIFDPDYQKISEQKFQGASCLYHDSRGGFWLGSRNGLVHFPDARHPEQYEVLGAAEGLAEPYIRSIQEDQSGCIWITNFNSIARWDAAQHRFYVYDSRDGINVSSFSENSTYRAPNGRIFFGSTSGVYCFNPEQLIQPVAIPQIEIVSHDQTGNTEHISFSVPDYALRQMMEYSYKLDGIDKDWVVADGTNEVTYHSLPFGQRTFHVRARLHSQPWEEAVTTDYTFRVKPPFWLSLWAILCYLLLVVGAIALCFRLYRRRLLLQNARELQRKRHQSMEELNHERLRFYTGITHELRTPLTLIMGPLEDLSNAQDMPQGYKSRIRLIQSNASQLLHLVNQLLEFRKTETQNRPLRVAKGDLCQVVHELTLNFRELNHKPEISIEEDLPEGMQTIYFDKEVVSTILTNLLGNAIKYTDSGRILVKVCQHDGADGQPLTELSVSDTGIGISPSDQERIFDRYYQAQTKHQASGTGIGLALSRSLAQMHEGTLTVMSELGKGSTFTFRILTENTYPSALHLEETKETPAAVAQVIAEENEDAETDQQPLLLIVEDNDDIREYIASSLSDKYRIAQAPNGNEAFTLAHQQLPDLIVSDIMMPIMDGLELCRAVKSDIVTSHIPVILLTAKDTNQDKVAGYDCGADSYLTKPFSIQLLASRIENLINSRRRLAALLAPKVKPIERDAKPAEVKSEEDQALGTEQLSKLDRAFLERLKTSVEENLAKPNFDLNQLCQMMNMSHSTLYRKVKALTGISCNEYIRKSRLRHCYELIVNEGTTISEAAYMSGFNDLNYFRQCFKAEFGMAPTEFLRK